MRYGDGVDVEQGSSEFRVRRQTVHARVEEEEPDDGLDVVWGFGVSLLVQVGGLLDFTVAVCLEGGIGLGGELHDERHRAGHDK